MNEYIGKICPYCKTALTMEDEMVVCSECDMPHHKDCWVENQGCTTFGCLGTIKAVDHAESSVTATQMQYDTAEPVIDAGFIFCTRCGKKNPKTSAFCPDCGNRLVTAPLVTPQTPVYAQQEVELDLDVKRLIEKNEEYYVPRFQEMKREKRAASWNHSACYWPQVWLMYRKMYGLAFAVLGAELLVALLGPVFTFLSIGGNIAFGIFGNSLYLKRLEKKAEEAKTKDELQKFYYIAKNGGVNVVAMIFAIILSVIISTLAA